MLPDRRAAQVPPPAPALLEVAPVMAAGGVAAPVAPVAMLGPLFDATIVYVMGEPGTAVACPSVLVIERLACGVRASTSVAALLARFVSVTPPGAGTVAGLLRLPVADALIVPVRPQATQPPTP